jgi:hypothetical protein
VGVQLYVITSEVKYKYPAPVPVWVTIKKYGLLVKLTVTPDVMICGLVEGMARQPTVNVASPPVKVAVIDLIEVMRVSTLLEIVPSSAKTEW